ncbi:MULTISPECIES: hypothetical protein [unclassified Ensifer]|uniref:hypothetical protein n=1 Tax=unclassified Ensifer TaxID=2633371 RepID=UPI00070B7B60|nr:MULTISPECIES: hypothetical protein [unclassified Ensifer]KQW62865.1 hypothetical protein ASD02_01715 [Ensifer sp. Root1252]KRC83686.1 hypothetical protein ASE32_01705 [Ensifer sp. Root231]KRD04039.1 hypothetical protein ASE47_00365 [Ensifer sp. Root258]
MKFVVVGDVVRFAAGQALKLSAAQIDARRHALEIADSEKGEVIVAGPVEFKRGEEIGLKEKLEELPRSLSDVLEAATGKARRPANSKPGKGDAGKPADQSGGGDDDLDALEKALEDAEKTLNEACAKHGIAEGADPSDEQKALVAAELAAYQAAKTAFDAAIGD